MDINKVIMVGRLTQDPEKRIVGQYTVTKFNIAVGERKKDEVSFFNCQAWGSLADIVSQYASKGKQVGIEGRLKQERWEKDGKKESRVIINVENLQLLGSKDTPKSFDEMGTQVTDYDEAF